MKSSTAGRDAGRAVSPPPSPRQYPECPTAKKPANRVSIWMIKCDAGSSVPPIDPKSAHLSSPIAKCAARHGKKHWLIWNNWKKSPDRAALPQLMTANRQSTVEQPIRERRRARGAAAQAAAEAHKKTREWFALTRYIFLCASPGGKIFPPGSPAPCAKAVTIITSMATTYFALTSATISSYSLRISSSFCGKI